MSDLILKVTPEEVRAKAMEIRQQKEIMEGYMNEMQNKMVQLEEYWTSDSGRRYTEKYQNVSGNIRKSLDALMVHTENLLKAAERYEQLELSQSQKVESLAVDNIF